MARVQLSQSRVRAQRRRRRWLLAGYGALALMLVFGGLVWLSWAPFLRITAVDVAGAQTLSTSSVAALVSQDLAGSYLHLFAKNNIFLYPKSSLAQNIAAALPAIAQAQVGATNFNTITVTVRERQPKALWCGEQVASSTAVFGGCSLMDQDGVVYAPADSAAATYDRYFGALASTTMPKEYLPSAQFRALTALVDALAQKVPNDTVQSVYVDSNKDVYLTFGSGFELMFALADDGGDVYQRFVLALGADPFTSHPLSDFEYLDLRFGDRLYYKLK